MKESRGREPKSRIATRRSGSRRTISFFLVLVMLFQSIAGVFLYMPASSSVKASYADPWHSSSWTYRKPITFDKSKIPHTDVNNANTYLTDFPVLVSLTDTDLKTEANSGKVKKADGSDIIFTGQNCVAATPCSPLAYEIESYDGTNGTLVAWVKVPQLNDTNAATSTLLYMYYGNASAPANTTANGTWDTNFKAVYHLKETGNGQAGDYKDSTVNANNSTNTAGQPTVATPGKIGNAQSFNGTSQSVDIANNSSLNPTTAITVDVWVKADALVNGQFIINKWNDSADGYSLHLNYSMLYFELRDGAYGTATSVYTPYSQLTTDWMHVVSTYDNVNGGKLYVNGVLKNQNTDVSKAAVASSRPLRIGVKSNGTSFWDGSIDEVRISNSVRSADWIKTEYNNQGTPGSFYALGSEENDLPAVLAEVAPVSSPTSDSTPSYTFSSNKAGTITYGGDCSASATSATAGNNTVTFNLLALGTHGNCTIKVTDAFGNESGLLSVSSFTINADLTAYVVPAITDTKILPASTISSAYRGDSISAQASPGEYKALSFVVSSNVNIPSFQVESSDLTDGNGHTITAGNVDIKAVKVWYQGGYAAYTYSLQGRYLTPELLLKDDSLVDVEGDDWSAWNVTNPNGKNFLKINGTYTDISTTLSAGNNIPIADRPIQDATTLQPIDLPANYNKQFWVTLHVPEEAAAADYQGTISLKNGEEAIKELNLSLKVLPIDLLEPNVEYSIFHHGVLSAAGTIASRAKSSEQYLAEMEDLKAHGVSNPAMYAFGTDANLLQELSLRQQAGLDNTKFYYVGAIAPELTSYYKELTAPYGVREFYQYGPDEGAVDRNRLGTEHAAGGKHFNAEFTYSLADSAADILDTLVAGYFWPDLAAKYHSYGHKVYLYNTPQALAEYPRTYRQNYGLRLWQNDYDGTMNYIYQASQKDIWNDFDVSGWRDFSFAYPTADGVIDTVQWEGFREGINDMRYLATLQSAIAAAESQGGNTTATEADDYLDSLKSSDLASQDLDAVRSQIIEYVLSLQSDSYRLTVDRGTGSDFYPAGSSVNVAAVAPQAGLVFDEWTGDTQYLSDVHSANPTVTMPDHAITLSASFTSSWYSSDYGYRKQIIIDHDKVANTAQTDFPVLVSSVDNDLRTLANGGRVGKADGSDLRFVSPDGTVLSHEVESYDAATGRLVVWIRIPSLSATSDTLLYMYYGNAAAPATTASGTWDTNFKAVYHLKETGTGQLGDYKDSTVNANHSANTANQPAAAASGKVGSAQTFSGTAQYVSINNAANLNPVNSITVSAWVKASALENGHYIINKWNDSANGYTLHMNYSNLYFQLRDGSYGMATSVNVPYSQLTTDWMHIVGTYDNVNGGRLYVNGILKNQNTDVSKTAVASTNPLRIGTSFNGTSSWNGSLDEVRLSNAVRSADWIKTEYENQSDPAAFSTLSSQEGYLDHITITGSSLQLSGRSQTLTLTAIDINGDVDTLFTGDKSIVLGGAAAANTSVPTFTDKDGSKIDFGSYGTLTFTNGVAHTDITLYRDETARITANDGSCNATPSLAITVPGNVALLPSFPSPASSIVITALAGGGLSVENLPAGIAQIAVCDNPDFKDIAWEDIGKKEELLGRYRSAAVIYLKFRTRDGGVSDVIAYEPGVPAPDGPGAQPLRDGDIVKTPDSPDIYILKLVGGKAYKRLILSPRIFSFYHHLRWEDVRTISREELDRYVTSDLVRELLDAVIYEIRGDKDEGNKQPASPGYDPQGVYIINKEEEDSYGQLPAL